jgi:organic radical activating enzyme
MYNGTLGERHVCCLSSLDLGKGSKLLDIWNGEDIRNLRTKMLNGEKIESCSKCYENLSQYNYKYHFNANYGKFLKEVLDNTDENGYYSGLPFTFDYRNDLCNLKCRMCGSTASSSIRAEFTKFGKYQEPSELLNGEQSKQLADNQLEEMLFLIENTDIQEIYWAGGEPLFNINHYKVLERLIELGKTNVYLRYNTNLTNITFRDYDFIEMIKKFSRVDFYFSQDGVGEIAEYVRYGQDFEKWKDNLNKLISIKRGNWRMYFHSVLTILTLLDIENILEFVLSHKELTVSYFKCFSDLNKNILVPEFYPKEDIERIINDKINLIETKYSDKMDNENIQITLNHLKLTLNTFNRLPLFSDTNYKNLFGDLLCTFNYINDLDMLRPYKKSFFDIIYDRDISLFGFIDRVNKQTK